MRDLNSNIKAMPSLRPQSVTAAANGTGVDLAGFESAAVEFNAGAITGTTPSYLFAVQESDDNSTFTVTATNAGITVVGYMGDKRYIRGIAKTVTGTTPTLLCSATVILGHPRNAPAV
jgi:hypothetical protein